MSTPRVSVIVPTYNKARYLELSLASWRHQRFSDYELIIIDDGSTDSTPEVLRKYSDRLPMRCINSDHRGRSFARNRGLEAARGSIVIFADDDRVVPPDFSSTHVTALETSPGPWVMLGWDYDLLVEFGGTDKTISPAPIVARLLKERPQLATQLSLGRRVQAIDAADIDSGFSRIPHFLVPSIWQSFVGSIVEVYGDDISDCPLAWACGYTGNMATRRELLERTGGFDETFTGWGLEDTELLYRLVKAGARTRVLKEAVNFHQTHPRDLASQKWEWVRNAKTFLARHESMDVAMLIQVYFTNTSLPDACRILAEARAAGETPLVQAYRRLLISQAQQLATLADMSMAGDAAAALRRPAAAGSQTPLSKL